MLPKTEEFIPHFKMGISHIPKAINFIKKHQLWKGMQQYSWLNKLSIFVGMVLGIKIFKVLMDFLFHLPITNPIAITSSVFHLVKDVSIESYELFFLGGFKYIIVLALEVLIIHFGGKTTEILTGVPFKMTFKDFLSDQIRAFKMILRKYILELIVTAAIGIALKIIGFGYIETPLVLVIQCYFLGVVIMDNYFKHRGKTTKESEQIIRQYAGLATAIGMFFYIMLFIPIIGAVVGACIAAVASTLVLYELKPLENSQNLGNA